MSGWIDSSKTVPLADVASHVGVGHVRGRTVAPCPACGAERRGSKDRRGPVDLHERDGRELWHCKRCDTGGDALDMVALVVVGRRMSALDRDGRDLVQAWYSDRGHCEPPSGHHRPVVTPQPVARRIPEIEQAPEYLPDGDPEKFWSLCSQIGVGASDDVEPLFYLLDRGYDVRELCARQDIVRATPRALDNWPAWFPAGHAPRADRPGWRRFRLAFRAYTADGALRGLHFRRVPVYGAGDLAGLPVCEGCGVPLERSGAALEPSRRRVLEGCPACGWGPRLKTLWPAGHSAERLLFADAGGVAVMRGEPSAPRLTLVVEGVTDLLRAAMVAPLVPCAVIGFTSGGAEALGDVAWRQDAVIAVATDSDKAGDAYAEKAADAVAPRRVVRVRWGDLGAAGDAPDTDDALRSGGAEIVRRAFALTKPAPTREERAAASRFASKVRRMEVHQ